LGSLAIGTNIGKDALEGDIGLFRNEAVKAGTTG
jgi:hypothetical protein